MIADATLAAGLFTATLAMRGLVLFLESSPKTHALKAQYKGAPPESTNGLFSLFLLWWLNPLLRLGSKEDLSLQSLLRLGTSMNPSLLLKHTSTRWALGGLNLTASSIPFLARSYGVLMRLTCPLPFSSTTRKAALSVPFSNKSA